MIIMAMLLGMLAATTPWGDHPTIPCLVVVLGMSILISVELVIWVRRDEKDKS